MESRYDVAIIGGGPAGSTAATLLARRGYKVILFEKEKFPRFHIGESLLPYSMGTFDRLRIREKLDAQFLPKFGAEICTVCGTSGSKFDFRNAYRVAYERSYQVTRSEFDKLLLDHAAENGATVMEEAKVEHLTFSEEEVGITIQRSGEQQTISAAYVIDCSGRNTVIGNFFRLKKPYSHLKKFSVFAHYEDVARDPGIEGTYTRLVRGSDRWFWMIPLSETRMSIGVVLDVSAFKAMGGRPEDVFDKMLREQPEIWNRMSKSRRISPVYAESDYSYRNREFAGKRWLLAGDAAGFIDPIFSTGVFIALESAEAATDAIDTALQNPAARSRAFKSYSRKLRRTMNLYVRLVGKWYKPRFIEVITQPTNRFQLSPVVNSMLAGNIERSFTLWWRIELFYLLTFLQRYIPICPRASLIPKGIVDSGSDVSMTERRRVISQEANSS